MKEIYIAIEQQRVTRDYVDNMGPPTQDRLENILREREAKREAEHSKRR